MVDTHSASDLYRPTNYWSNYEETLLQELRSLGLRDFRRRKNSILTSFGATDLLPVSKHLNHLPIWKHVPFQRRVMKNFFWATKLRAINKAFNHISRVVSGVGIQEARMLCYEFAKSYGEKNGARIISELESSTVGNPEDVFFVNGKAYTMSILYYYIQYAYCCQFIDFNRVDTMLEIGCGSGKQVEVIKKLHPRICFYVADIPPQIYVCEQYLSALFPNSVVSYRKSRRMKRVPGGGSGKIFILGNWKLPELMDLNYDLFWNSASFQEMEPEIVLNYLKYVNEQTNRYVFLHEMMDGMDHKAEKRGEHGVLERTTLNHYKRGLKEFQLTELSAGLFLPEVASKYNFSFWRRKGDR